MMRFNTSRLGSEYCLVVEFMVKVRFPQIRNQGSPNLFLCLSEISTDLVLSFICMS